MGLDQDSSMNLTVSDSVDQHRFEARTEAGALAGFADYITTEAGLIVFTHTEVMPAYERQGVGSQLARAALDNARARHLKVLPICPFFDGWISRHHEYSDLLYRATPSKVVD